MVYGSTDPITGTSLVPPYRTRRLPRVFFSYAHHDLAPKQPIVHSPETHLTKEAIERVLRRLRSMHGTVIDLFVDEQIRIGDPLSTTLQAELTRADVLVAAVTEAWLASAWCRAEARFVRPPSHRGVVFPIAIEHVEVDWVEELKGLNTMWFEHGTKALSEVTPMTRGASEFVRRLIARIRSLDHG